MKEELNMEMERVWVRLAINKQAWKEGSDFYWRIFIDPDSVPIRVKGAAVFGQVTPKNHVTRGLPKRDDERDLLGFVHYFGDVSFENDVARINLLDPEA